MKVGTHSNEMQDAIVGAMRQVLAPIETARGLPNACYADPAVMAIEQRRIFREGWFCAGFVMDVPDNGDLSPIEVAGLPLFLSRGMDGAIRVFHNVCRHRGRILVEAPTNTKKAIMCPYHSWTYGLDGRLIGTPHIGGPGKHTCPGFDGTDIGLKEVRSAEWFGLIFVDLSGIAEAFGTYIQPLARRWRAFEGVPLVHTGADCRIEFELACNWKLAVENYCEAYHLPWVHPELNRYSPLEQHYAIVEQTYSGQGSNCYAPGFPEGAPAFPNAPSLPAFWGSGAEYVALFPNVLLGLHRDHFFAVLIQADGPAATKERFEIFYFDESVRDAAFDKSRNANKQMWRTIFSEDRAAVEGMQRGRYSPAFDGGIFSPAMDPPTHAFHCWIAQAMIEGRGTAPGTASSL
jgi:choline monooxygenase